MNDVWIKMAEFLGRLNGESVSRETYVRTCTLPEYLTKRTYQREIIREEAGNGGKPREIKGCGEFDREKMKHL